MAYKEETGNLIHLALDNKFDVVAHGTNCFCVQGAGIAPQMVKAFGTDKFKLEDQDYRANMLKLGTIDYQTKMIYLGEVSINDGSFFTRYGFVDNSLIHELTVVNAYTQYGFGSNHDDGTKIPLDYEALTLCMRKMNHIFKGKKIGLPQIGCGLAGGSWDLVKQIIQDELVDCDVTVVIYG